MSAPANQRIHRLPLPLAQLLLRTVNAKSPVEQHHCAYYLVEASIKLAASARIGLWLQTSADDHPMRSKLQLLAHPSAGHWRQLLRDVHGALLANPETAAHPLLTGLATAPRTLEARAFAEAAVSHDVLTPELRRSVTRSGVAGFLDAVVAYRNAVLGHGAQRSDAFYAEMGPLLLQAGLELLASGLVLGGLKLGVTTVVVESGAPHTRWLDLTGLAGLPMAAPPGDAVPAGALCVVGGSTPIPLHPLIVWSQAAHDPMGRVGFLNRAIHRASGDGRTIVRRADYLDYTTGQLLTDVDCRAELASFLMGLGLVSDPSDAEPLPEAPDAADPPRFVGDYELLEELGRGGMGVVWKARQIGIGRVVALKVLPAPLAGDTTARERFHREIRALARSDHPHVVRVLSHGDSDGQLHYAMEYVHGADLAQTQRLLSDWREQGHSLSEASLPAAARGEGPPPTLASALPQGDAFHRRLAALFSDAADGLHHLHELGVVHRDVKPGNLMLTADGERLVVTDLGLAQLDDVSQALTATHVKVLGTLRYMSPEQLQRNLLEVDRRADVYALGATLTELCTGQPFFDGDTEQRLIHQILNEDPPPAHERDRSVPPDLSLVLQKATSKRAGDRYATGEAFGADLRAFSEGRAVSVRPPGLVRRSRMWVSRHPLGATAALTVAVSMALFVAGLAVVGAAEARLNDRVRHYRGIVADGGGYKGHGWMPDAALIPSDIQEAMAQATPLYRRGEVGAHYLVTRKDGRDVRIEHVDDAGALAWSTGPRRPPILVQSHDASGHVEKLELHSATELLYTVNTSCTEAGEGTRCLRTTFDPHGQRMKDRTWDVFTVAETHNAEGQVILEHFSDAGTPMHSDGAWGRATSYDDNGRVERRWLGPDGEAVRMANGAWVDRRLFEDGAFSGIGYFDLAGQPMRNARGWHRYGRVEEQRPPDPAVWDVLPEDVRSQLTDAARLTLREVHYAPDGTVVADRDGCVSDGFVRGAFGERLAHLCQDEAGSPMVGTDGYAFRSSRFEGGVEVERRYFDAEGKPTTTRWGFARWTATVQDGLVVSRRHWGLDGQLVADADGVAGWDRSYDAVGRTSAWHYVGPDERPAIRRDLGYASVRYAPRADTPVPAPLQPPRVERWVVRDALEREVRATHVGGPHDGWTVRVTEWTGQDTRTRTTFDADGRPVARDDGVHREERTTDRLGRVSSLRAFGLDGPVPGERGCTELRHERDDWGRETAWSCLDAQGDLVASTYGWARVERTYDERGRETSKAWFDEGDRPVPAAAGAAHILRDPRDGEPRLEIWTMADGSRASRRVELDALGRSIRVSWLDGSSQVVDGPEGWAREHRTRDALGHVIRAARMDVSGEPVARGWATAEHTFDDRGLAVSSRWFAADGSPAPGPDGESETAHCHDALDRPCGEDAP